MNFKYPVLQPQGTCYLETGLSLLENIISIKLNQEIAISRPALYANLWYERGKAHIESTAADDEDPQDAYDLLSAGKLSEILAMLSLSVVNKQTCTIL